MIRHFQSPAGVAALLAFVVLASGCSSSSPSSSSGSGSLSGMWLGDIAGVYPLLGGHARVSITQNGLNLTGTYKDDSHEGSLAGTTSATGAVTFTVTVTDAGVAPFTFTGGTGGMQAATLVGTASGLDFVDKSWVLTRS